MRKLAYVLIGLVVLVVVAVIAIPRLLDVEHYRGRIQSELEQRLGRQVTLGRMRLSVIPLAFRAESAAIAEDPRFGPGNFATISELDVRAKLMPLLGGNVEVSSVRLQRPTVELIRNANGEWNFSSLGKPAQQPAPTPGQQPAPGQPAPGQQPAPQQAPAEAQRRFELALLQIKDGTVAITNQQKKQPRAVYDHIDVELRDFAPDKQFSIKATAQLPGEGSQTINLNGTAGPIDQAVLINTPFNGRVEMEEASLSAVQKFLNNQALEDSDATISGRTDVQSKDGRLVSSGSLTLDDPRVRGVKIGYPIRLDYDLTSDLKSDVIQIRKGEIKLGNTPMNVTGSVATNVTPALLDLQLKASNVSIEEAARLAAAFGVAFNPNMKVSGRVNADLTAKGASNQPAMNGTLAASNINVSGDDLPAPVSVQGVTLSLTPQTIQSNDFNATSGSTNLATRFTLSQYTSKSPMVDATLRTANANIAELLGMARAYGIGAAQGFKGTGTLNLDVRATGPVKDSNRMNFAGSGKIANASLQPQGFAQPLKIANADIRFTQNSAALQNLQASLASTNASGSATVRNFNAPNFQFTFNADQVNVAEIQQAMGGSAPANAPAQQQPQQAQQQPAQPQQAQPQQAKQSAPAPAAASNQSALAKITGAGDITVGQIKNDQLVLNNVRAKVTIERGMVRLAPLTAAAYNGSLNGTITANLLTTPMQVNVQSRIDSVDANNLLSAMSSLDNTIYGLLASGGNLSFSTASGAQELARSINGAVNLNLVKGRIAGIDMLNQLAAVGKFAGFTQNAQPFTSVARLTGGFDIKNGVAFTNNLQAAIEGGTLAGRGSVDLANQTLNMNVTAVLSKAVADRVGGVGIGGYLTTALANNKGELVMPVLITGTFANPKVTPDTQAIAEMKLKQLLPTSGNPGQLTTGILGAVLGSRGQQQQQPQGGIGGILGTITGQQQQQQNQQQPEGAAQPTQPPQPNQAQPQGNQAGGRQRPRTEDRVMEALGSLLGGKKNQKQQPQQQPEQQQQQQQPQP